MTSTGGVPPASERTPEGLAVTLRPAGCSRILSIAFFPVWLAGWFVGEVFALNVLLSLLGSELRPWFPLPLPTFGRWPPTPGLLILLVPLVGWLAFWTWGGVSAIVHLLRAIAGRDVILFGPTAVTLIQQAGPFARRRAFERLRMRTVVLDRHTGPLVLVDDGRRRHPLTAFGTPEERRWLRDRLREHYALRPPEPAAPAPEPRGWERVPQQDGAVRLVATERHGSKSIGCAAVLVGIWWVPTLWLAWHGLAAPGAAGGPIALMTIGLLPLGVLAWTVAGRRVRLVGRDRLEDWIEFFGRRRHRVFTRGRFRVVQSSDSDGDDWFELRLQPFDGTKPITLERVIHAPEPVLTWATYLQARTGWPLEIDPAARNRET